MKRKLIIIFSIMGLLILLILFSIYFLFLHHYSGHFIEYEWNEDEEFNINNIKTLNKEKDKDFIILNLADIQMCDLEDIFHMNKIKKEIEFLVEQTHPDLITLTGDQTWSNENIISLKSLIRWLDNLKIPYAPIFGNHDFGNDGNNAVAGAYKCCDLYENGKYSLFKRGPSNLDSIGNYLINIAEDGKIIKTLVMMDNGYNDKITNMQQKWFSWNMEGLFDEVGYYPEVLCFMHKPLPQHFYAYLNKSNSDDNTHVYYSFSGVDDNGFFDLCKIYNVKHIVCGHQHGNSFTLFYDDINMTFALKTGELGGYVEIDDLYLNGATYFIVSESIEVKNIFVPKKQFHIDDKYNVYLKRG